MSEELSPLSEQHRKQSLHVGHVHVHVWLYMYVGCMLWVAQVVTKSGHW